MYNIVGVKYMYKCDEHRPEKKPVRCSAKTRLPHWQAHQEQAGQDAQRNIRTGF